MEVSKKSLQLKIPPENGGTKTGYEKLYVITETMRKLQTKVRSIGGSLRLQALGLSGWEILWLMDARVRFKNEYNTLAQDRGNADYLSTWGTKGNRWKHFGNQGRQSDTWHRRKGKVPETKGKFIFQNKTGNDETKQNFKTKCHRFMTWIRSKQDKQIKSEHFSEQYNQLYNKEFSSLSSEWV